jgi:hypothetical protein
MTEPSPEVPSWDADTLVKVIGEALKNKDFQGVEAGIRVLATVDPGKAQDVYDTIQAGLMIRERAAGQ